MLYGENEKNHHYFGNIYSVDGNAVIIRQMKMESFF